MADENVWQVARRVSGSRARPAPSTRLTPSSKQRLGRIVRKSPEVMVKVTGRSFGPGHLKAHLDYVTRNGSLIAIGGDGRTIESRPELRSLHDEWVLKNELATCRRDEKSASAVHLMLSMPPQTDREAVEHAASAWAANILGDRYDYILTRHDDQGHPHVHVTVRAVGYDGRRLRVDRDDLQTWREHFAEKLRERGIDAEATPRKARGRTLKADRHAVRQLKDRGVVPRVELEARREVAREARMGKADVKAWETRIAGHRENVRAAYASHATELEAGSDSDRQLARDIRRFVADMPVAHTRRQLLQDELLAATKRGRPAPDREAPNPVDLQSMSEPKRPDRDVEPER